MLKLGKALLKLASLLITWFGGAKELLFWIFFEKVSFSRVNVSQILNNFKKPNIKYNLEKGYFSKDKNEHLNAITSFWCLFERWPCYVESIYSNKDANYRDESVIDGVYIYVPRVAKLKDKILYKVLETQKTYLEQFREKEVNNQLFDNDKLCFACWTKLKADLVFPDFEEHLLNAKPCWHKTLLSKFSWEPALNDLIERISKFCKSANWYRERGIPYRLGVLLYGEPGNGKSQLINYLKENFSLYTGKLINSGPDNQLCIGFTTFDNISSSIKLLVIEDYDSIFNGRENISKTLKGDFSQLLELIDAFEGLVFITTNKLESIDPAIGIPVNGKSTRPGRIHRILKMGPPSEKVRTDIANNILYGYPDKIADIVKEGEGESYAQFTDRCTTLALDLYWKLPV